ncbi:hypothetical protein XENOCAPTIV_000616 [Xenoophorus captivus]|uniref:D-aminoacyl-tRNA deacylase n=1 Tax=Xenoophorus captivus TaxID=1517983 RepID=A0ABV0QP32_9TELE
MTIPIQSDTLNSSEIQYSNQSLSKKPTESEDLKGTRSSENCTDVHHFIQGQGTALPLLEPHPLLNQTQTLNYNRRQKTKKTRALQGQRIDRCSLKRKRGMQGESFTQGSSSCGLEPVVAPSSKPWPVFTIGNSALEQAGHQPRKVESPLVLQKSKMLQARTIIQQCSHAKVKVRRAVDGADAEWVEIEQGLVVYVCFFRGATEEVILEMGEIFFKFIMFLI